MRAMFTVVLRLMTIIALAMMPLGMAGASVAGQATMAETTAAHTMGGEHCPDAGDEDSAPARSMDCAAACTGLPASPAEPLATPDSRPALPTGLGVTRIFADNIPEIATPPPRLGRG
ncbi:MAG TPA: hypothetical protein VFO45_08330 [Sphingomicrobium sp.]|nr:hypothetical protein [Sphingomicrobium sp.]